VDRQTFEKVDMSALVQDACELFQPIAEDKEVALTWHADASVTVSGDRQMLQRLAANLIDNAIKYCRPGDAVSLKLSTTESDGVTLEVEDTGPGIPEKDQPFVFDRFFRGDQSRTQGGSGLGLSLARAIVQAHGGRIAVQSTSGQGSRFTVSLPFLS
jgi:signal transduction histidine kinase